MTLIKQRLPYLLMLLIIPVLGGIYTVLNKYPGPSVNITMEIDRYIPFIPVFVIPYIIWYAFILGYLVYFCMKDTKVYFHTLITITIGELICFVIYIFFQTTVPRPMLSGNDLITQLVQFIYTNDEPYNCFPSIHVLTTYVIMLASIHIKGKHLVNTLILQGMGTLIILSTLFIKQHVLWDVIASIVMTSIIYLASFYFSTTMKRRSVKRTRVPVTSQVISNK